VDQVDNARTVLQSLTPVFNPLDVQNMAAAVAAEIRVQQMEILIQAADQ
jgi:hypothetical protein